MNSPEISLDFRLSLDTSGIDSDGEREESILSKSTHQQHFVYPESSEDKVEHDTAGQQEVSRWSKEQYFFMIHDGTTNKLFIIQLFKDKSF